MKVDLGPEQDDGFVTMTVSDLTRQQTNLLIQLGLIKMMEEMAEGKYKEWLKDESV